VRKLILVIPLLIVLSTPLLGQVNGAIGGGLGATIPQGEFNTYTKTGFSIMGFGTIRALSMPYLGLRLGVQGVFFEHDNRRVVLEGYPDDLLTETYTNDLLKATLGIEFSKRFMSIEPYVGGGIGVYYFETKTELKTDEDEVVASNKLDSKTKFGYNLNGGMKIYFFAKVAIDLNIQFDIVQDLEQYSEEKVVSFNSEFLSLFAGVSIPFGF